MRAIIESRPLKEVLKACEVLDTEAIFNFNADGLSVNIVDKANVCMAIMSVPADVFEVYEPGDGEALGIDVQRLHKLSKNLRDKVELNSDEGYLKLTSNGLKYSISLIDSSAIRKPPKEPKINLEVKAVMTIGELRKTVNACDSVSDRLRFKSDEESFIIESSGDVDSLEMYYSPDDLKEFVGGEANTLVSIEYFKEMSKIGDINDSATLLIGTNMPVKYRIDSNGVIIEYILAPRIEEAG